MPEQNPPSNQILSDRELEILLLICQEMNTKEISKVLFISPKIIEAHISDILLKTGAKNSVGLVLYALENKLIDVNRWN